MKPDWSTVVVVGNIDEFYAESCQWEDGTDMTDKELDDLDPSKLYDICFDSLVMKAEYAFEGDR